MEGLEEHGRLDGPVDLLSTFPEFANVILAMGAGGRAAASIGEYLRSGLWNLKAAEEAAG